MTELELKYGCNPNQKPARIFMEEGELPIQVLNGKPGYINFLDAFNSWQLVKELEEATGLPAAASFKHVSPAGAAVGTPLTDVERKIYFAEDMELSPIACAYVRARGADRLCSYGDWAALSDVCDADTARYLALEVSDGVIAPGYTDEALAILKTKRKGGYNVVQIDPDYAPKAVEHKDVFGITFEQGRNSFAINEALLDNIVTDNKELPESAKRDMLIALITLKYTQSNSVCYVKDGQACLLYTSDAADELDGVDLGGRRIIKKKFFQAEDGIRDQPRSRGLGDVYKRQVIVQIGDSPSIPSTAAEFSDIVAQRCGAAPVSYTHLTLPTN